MIKLIIQYPYIDNNNIEHFNQIKHYAEDENGMAYKILQVETGIMYDDAIDIYPSKYEYITTDILVEIDTIQE